MNVCSPRRTRKSSFVLETTNCAVVGPIILNERSDFYDPFKEVLKLTLMLGSKKSAFPFEKGEPLVDNGYLLEGD